ncbi:MAG: 4-alpha-glucanotransferase, partial [Clostridia bacterium]
NEYKSFLEWDDLLKLKDDVAIDEFKEKNGEEIDFWKFIQFKCFEQYLKLKTYANEQGIKIIGDMPIYVALDSSDVWANKKCFLLDENMTPSLVAGVPPDAFTSDGQLWGNPIYDWEYLKNNNYIFWEKRIEFASKMYDLVRIDHFRGFAGYYVIDAKAENAKDGKWLKGPSIDLFNTLAKSIDVSKIIAEDLGYLTEDVYELVAKTGYMGMKVLQFGLIDEENEYFYKNYPQNTIAYTGTHDNETTLQCIEKLTDEQKNIFEKLYKDIDEKSDLDKAIGAVFASKSQIAIVPMQDFLKQGEEYRMNFPSKPNGFWKYRIAENDLNLKLIHRIKHFVKKYDRE